MGMSTIGTLCNVSGFCVPLGMLPIESREGYQGLSSTRYRTDWKPIDIHTIWFINTTTACPTFRNRTCAGPLQSKLAQGSSTCLLRYPYSHLPLFRRALFRLSGWHLRDWRGRG